MDSIAKTSLLTAAMRAVETNRSDSDGRLFSDPYAELLAGNEGKALLQKAIAESGDQPAIAVRTAFMDQKIKEATENGVRQIVMLAAGMDTRAYRLGLPSETRIFELDREAVLEYKLEKLSNIPTQCKRTAVSVDLKESWQENLLQAGFYPEAQTLWLVEGLLMYLEEPQVLMLLERVNNLAKAKDIFLCDILTRSLLVAPHMKRQLQFLADMGAPWKFGTDEPEQLMKGFGWDATVTQPGEFAPKRWPFPTAPRHVPNVPRGFYLRAVRV